MSVAGFGDNFCEDYPVFIQSDYEAVRKLEINQTTKKPRIIGYKLKLDLEQAMPLATLECNSRQMLSI